MFKTSLERIRRDIESLAAFTSVKGPGCTRFAYTKECAQARDYIIAQMEQAGLSVRQDAVGAIIGRLEGKDPTAPALMTGSHFDTVKNGGRFDGTAGLVAALETARVFHDEGFRPTVPIEFVAMPEEEGSRFGSGLMISRAMCGKLPAEELTTFRDPDGVSIAEGMRAYGLDPDRVGEAARAPGELGTFIELHIEQGPVLENKGADIGIVDAIVGIHNFEVTVSGVSNHAGTTPIRMRADTMLAAAKAIIVGTDKALALDDGTVVTFGRVETSPGGFNIVANKTVFTIDCRSRTLESVETVLAAVRASLEQSAAENEGLSFDMRDCLLAQPVPMKEELKALFEAKAAEAGISSLRMLSGAGHDTMTMAAMCDVAMIFVKSHNGRSHCPEEWTEYSDLQKGAEVLCRSIRELTK